MKNKTFITLIFVFIMSIALLNQIITAAFATPAEEDKQKVILIDPGHGGDDGGAVSSTGTLEKDINLSISLKLRDKLKEYGYIVLMTRETDKNLHGIKGSVKKKKFDDLNFRCKMKRESNCDIFLSIHQNFFPQPQYYGAQVWYSNCEESRLLAGVLQKNLRNDLDNTNRREEKAAKNDYKVLRCYYSVPSVLIECGFLSNYREEKELKNGSYQHAVAESIADSINEYFKCYRFCN